MQSKSSVFERDYIRLGNARRPTVINFHGFLRDEYSKDQAGRRNSIFAQKNRVKSCVKIPSTVKVERESHDKEEEGNNQDQRCLEADDDCCIPKRHRTSFTSFQVKRLEEEFEGDKYIIGMKRWRLSKELEIPEKQIKIWFQNRRTKVKRHCANCSNVYRGNRESIP